MGGMITLYVLLLAVRAEAGLNLIKFVNDTFGEALMTSLVFFLFAFSAVFPECATRGVRVSEEAVLLWHGLQEILLLPFFMNLAVVMSWKGTVLPSLPLQTRMATLLVSFVLLQLAVALATYHLRVAFVRRSGAAHVVLYLRKTGSFVRTMTTRTMRRVRRVVAWLRRMTGW